MVIIMSANLVLTKIVRHHNAMTRAQISIILYRSHRGRINEGLKRIVGSDLDLDMTGND